MSWQRIFAFVRERGLPVIVTDVAGREPVVVLPFSEYENLTALEDEKSRGPEQMPFHQMESVPLPEEPTSPDLGNIFAETEPPVEKNPLPTTEDSKSGIGLEEQFYLEPVDEEET